MALLGFTIFDLVPVATPATELPGGLWEVEVLTGPVAGAYVNKKLTTEQFVDYLMSVLPTGGGAGTVQSVSLNLTPYTPDTAGNVLLPAVDIYAVSASKRMQVIADYASAAGPIAETDDQYFGQQFVDDYSSPGDEYLFMCTPSAPAPGGTATIWKWRRYIEAS